MLKRALVCGAGGFIGSHMVKRLKEEGFWVKGVDLKHPEYSPSLADEFVIGDLRDPSVVANVIDDHLDELYQFAADMGGAGYIFTGDNDANVMHNSALINLNIAHEAVSKNVKKLFYSSSACIYPKRNQTDPDNPNCVEKSAYPAAPDSEYGWEKLFSERLYFSFMRNYGLNVKVARYHNIFGPEGTFTGGKEKAPAAICRKVCEANSNSSIEIWGDGKQTRSFLYIDECIEATLRLVRSDFSGPVNIGSEEMISINSLAQMIIDISGKDIKIKNISGPVGVRGRRSNNELYGEKIGWKVAEPLSLGIQKTYQWIKSRVT